MGRLPASLRVCGRDGSRHTLHGMRVDERDRAAAEAAARHARAMRASGARSLHGHVQFLAGDLVVVAQRVVRIVQESARDRQARAFQRSLVKKLDESARPRNFGDDVARASGQALAAQRGRGLVQVLNVHELAHAEDTR